MGHGDGPFKDARDVLGTVCFSLLCTALLDEALLAKGAGEGNISRRLQMKGVSKGEG